MAGRSSSPQVVFGNPDHGGLARKPRNLRQTRARQEGYEQALLDLLNSWGNECRGYTYHTTQPAGERREYLLGEIKKACGYRERMEFDTSNSHPGVEHY
jgi:hypothetical protein